MAKKQKTAFVCSNCGEDYPKWLGKCENCGEWDSLTEFRIGSKTTQRSNVSFRQQPPKITSLQTHESETNSRITSSMNGVDPVLGGGLVMGSFVLLAGDPGIGKSTLVLQLMSCWSESNNVFYVSGEESVQQVSLRAKRLGVEQSPIQVITETNMENLLEIFSEHKADIVVIDSIQTMYTDSVESAPGSVAQIRECGAMILRYAKTENVSVVIVGHVTKEGTIAGPRVLEHMVDTVLQFEGDGRYNYRIVRSVKNRFGPAGEIALFSMTDSGLKENSSMSEFLLMNREEPIPGTAIAPVLEGTRVLVLEIQALVNNSHFGIPQRVASGINPKKLSLLIAVLEKYDGLVLGDHDIFLNIAGGLSVGEPAADIAIIAALLSSFHNKPLRKDLAFIGELGLGGEIRPVNNMSARLKELIKMGFKECVVARPHRKSDWVDQCGDSISLIMCSGVTDIRDVIF
ncbi:DNA repair protein RadA [Chitinispirillum alkaliphilum]|nr:DNA repair protein RadA [Chitinispirillum alkaliphilum]